LVSHFRACTHKSRLLGNRWLPQTTCTGCARDVSGDLLPPSPPAEKATTSEDQTRQSGTGDRDRNGRSRSGHLNAVDEARASLGKTCGQAFKVIHEKSNNVVGT